MTFRSIRSLRPPAAHLPFAAVALAGVAFLTACDAGEGERGFRAAAAADSVRFPYGEVEDPTCGGTVETVRHGARIVLDDGREEHFNSPACLAAFVLERPDEVAHARALEVVDFNDGYRLLDVDVVTFLHTENLESPEGLTLLPVEDDRVAGNLHFGFGGDLLDWDGVLEVVRREWMEGGEPGERGEGG